MFCALLSPWQDGWTSVHYAAYTNKHDAVRKLLALRGDLSLLTKVALWLLTPVHIACAVAVLLFLLLLVVKWRCCELIGSACSSQSLCVCLCTGRQNATPSCVRQQRRHRHGAAAGLRVSRGRQPARPGTCASALGGVAELASSA